jgi:hypothetical protein
MRVRTCQAWHDRHGGVRADRAGAPRERGENAVDGERRGVARGRKPGRNVRGG